MTAKAGFIEVCTVDGEMSAQMVKLRLEVNGVPSMLVSETYWNLYLGHQAPFSIVVPTPYAKKAKKVLQERDFDMQYTIPKKMIWPYAIFRIPSVLICGR